MVREYQLWEGGHEQEGHNVLYTDEITNNGITASFEKS